MRVRTGVINKDVLRRFYTDEAISAFVAALEFGIPEDDLIQALFDAQIKRQLNHKTEEVSEQIGSQS